MNEKPRASWDNALDLLLRWHEERRPEVGRAVLQLNLRSAHPGPALAEGAVYEPLFLAAASRVERLRGHDDQALEDARRAAERISGHNWDVWIAVQLSLVQALQAAGEESEARAVARRTAAELRRVAARMLPDDRRLFLENVPPHARLLELATALG